ncbi:MAG TPA: D-aminoacyl-tRNA deacylase [Candidatus Acidoferrales bacterium]|nr:D-aminoacyl-tRNA deacylase [Candidatus Acidoferrales bacterium]
MRIVIQRVSEAQVSVDGERVARIAGGLCVFVGFTEGDREKDADYLAEKVAHLRIFEDEGGKMNRSLAEIGGEALVVSEFTLYGDCRQGRRPSFGRALAPEQAERLYRYFIERLSATGVGTRAGRFRARMKVQLVNDGPVTFILDSSP